MLIDCWEILGIAATKETREIRRAYAGKLKQFRPDEDPAGFQRLVEARDRAIFLAELPDAPEWRQEEDHRAGGDENTARPEEAPAIADVIEGNHASVGSGADKAAEEEERERIGAIYGALNQLIDAAKNDSWKAKEWLALFDRTALLGFDQHRGFHETIARRLGEFLPDPDRYRSNDIASFEAGFGPCAVVEQIEKECEFTWHGGHFVQIANPLIADRYFTWHNLAQATRALVDRRQNPDTAYVNPENGLPLIPQDDKAVLLGDEGLKEYFDKTEKTGLWPFKIDRQSVLAPGNRLFGIGFNKTGLATIAFTCAICIIFYKLRVERFGIAALCLLALVGSRIYFSTTYYKRASKQLVRHVKEADRQGLLFLPARRNFLVQARVMGGMANVLSLLEVAATLAIVIPIIAFISGWSNRDMLSQPAETVLADQMLSLMTVTAENDAVETKEFLKVFRDLSSAASQIRSNAAAETVKLSDLRVPLVITRMPREIEKLAKRSNWRLRPLSPAIARDRKLKALAALYRASRPEERREMERTIAIWGDYLEDPYIDPRFEALVWELMPPRQKKAQSVISQATESRRFALNAFLDSRLATISRFNMQNIAEDAAQLQLLLALPDDAMVGSVDAMAAYRRVIGDALSPGARKRDPVSIFNGLVGSVLTGDSSSTDVKAELSRHGFAVNYAVYDTPVPVWSEEAIGWANFLNTASTCLKFDEAADQQAVQKFLLDALGKAQQVTGDAKGSFWDSAARQLLTTPSCATRYAAFHNDKTAGGNFTQNGPLTHQINTLVNLGKRDEARQAARFAAAMVDGKSNANDDLAVFAYSYLAYDRLKAGEAHLALIYLDKIPKNIDLCGKIGALRGFVLKETGEDRRALRELRGARPSSTCSVAENVLGFQESDIEAAMAALEGKTGANGVAAH